MPDSLTLVSLISAPDRYDRTIAQTFAWIIPSEAAGDFAEEMTERFGEPVHEAMSSIGAMAEAADRDESAVYIDRTEACDG